MAPFGIKVLIVEPGSFRTSFAGDSLRHMPVLEAYRDVTGGIREFAHGMNGTQAGDPAKVPQAVVKALDAHNTPLRLQLGADAVEAVRAHSQQLLQDLEAWRPVAEATGFDV